MAAGARDLHIVLSRILADITAVVLVRWDNATARHVLAGFRFSIRHIIFPFFFAILA
jgi:hypothetical protein